LIEDIPKKLVASISMPDQSISTRSFSEMSVINKQPTLRRNPDGFCLHQKRYKNLTSLNLEIFNAVKNPRLW